MFTQLNQVGTKSDLLGNEVKKLLEQCLKPRKIDDLMAEWGWASRSKFRTKYIRPLLNEGLIEMTIPDKPQSSKQQYHTSEQGRKLIRE